MSTPTTDGILLQAYPAKLDDGDLARLSELAEGRLSTFAPKYARWIGALVSEELRRRALEQSGDPAEVQMPQFNASRWTGHDLAQALQASAAAIEISKDRIEVVELLSKLDKVLRAWIAHRLERCG